MKHSWWFAICACLVVGASRTVGTYIRVHQFKGLAANHEVIRLRIVVLHAVRMFVYAEFIVINMLYEIEAEEEDLLSFIEPVLQIVPEKHPIVGDGVVEQLV